MQCHDVRDLADAFIGEELLVETDHAIVRHLEACPACRPEVAARRALRVRLRAAFLESTDLAPRSEWSGAMVDHLRQQEAPAVRGRTAIGAWLALAATLLVAVGTASFLIPGWRGSSALAALARLAAGDHRNCAVRFNLAEKPISLAEASARYDAVYRVLETTPAPAVAAGTDTITVVDRHSCVYEGRRFAHIVMKYKGELVSLLVASDGSGPMTRLPAVHGPDGDVLTSSEGVHVIYAHAGGYAIFFVTDGGSEALQEVAHAVASDVSRSLAGA